MEAGIYLKHYSCHLIVESFSEQVNLKTKILTHFEQTYQKSNDFPYKKCHVTMTQKGKNLLIWKCQVTMAEKMRL